MSTTSRPSTTATATTSATKILQEVAKALARQCRKLDLPARYGGEEFTILVPHETSAGARLLAERCREDVTTIAVPVGDERVTATASFGVAEVSGSSSTEMLMRRADEALYRAKNAGRNRVCSSEGRLPRRGRRPGDGGLFRVRGVHEIPWAKPGALPLPLRTQLTDGRPNAAVRGLRKRVVRLRACPGCRVDDGKGRWPATVGGRVRRRPVSTRH